MDVLDKYEDGSKGHKNVVGPHTPSLNSTFYE